MLLAQVAFAMDYHFNTFLIDQIPTNGQHDHASLIKTSVRMLECLALIQKYRDKLADFLFGMAWWLVSTTLA